MTELRKRMTDDLRLPMTTYRALFAPAAARYRAPSRQQLSASSLHFTEGRQIQFP